VASLWVANLIGVLAAAVARSVAETALLSAVSTLLLLHGSGVFRTPSPGSVGAAVEAVAPYRALHETLLSMSSALPVEGGATLSVWVVTLPALAVICARPLVRVFRQRHRS
jgi:hypothetical protein